MLFKIYVDMKQPTISGLMVCVLPPEIYNNTKEYRIVISQVIALCRSIEIAFYVNYNSMDTTACLHMTD